MEGNGNELENVGFQNQPKHLILKREASTTTHANSHCQKLQVVTIKSVQCLKRGRNGQVAQKHVAEGSEEKQENVLKMWRMGEEDPETCSMITHVKDL